MVIESLELKNFRNYEYLSFNPSPGTNILYGENAQGKTNILESVFMACTSRSMRSARDREIIEFGYDDAHIRLSVKKNKVNYRIDMHLKKNKPKGIAINELPIHKISDLLGLVNVVSFSPEDLSLVKDGPQYRRRFMDLELCQLDPMYVYNLSKYNKVLEQRNKLLKDIEFHPSLEETLEDWDEQLILYGTKVVEARTSFIDDLKKVVEPVHTSLSGGKERLEIRYETNASTGAFRETLERLRFSERKLHVTLAGPHRDDIEFLINGQDIRKYGSQGQRRTTALSIKLSEIQLVKEKTGDYPILLLDDVLSELDTNRQTYLLNMLNATQNMITCTGLDDFIAHRFPIDELFLVEDGSLKKIEKLTEENNQRSTHGN